MITTSSYCNFLFTKPSGFHILKCFPIMLTKRTEKYQDVLFALSQLVAAETNPSSSIHIPVPCDRAQAFIF